MRNAPHNHLSLHRPTTVSDARTCINIQEEKTLNWLSSKYVCIGVQRPPERAIEQCTRLSMTVQHYSWVLGFCLFICFCFFFPVTIIYILCSIAAVFCFSISWFHKFSLHIMMVRYFFIVLFSKQLCHVGHYAIIPSVLISCCFNLF